MDCENLSGSHVAHHRLESDICLVDVRIGNDMGYELIECLSGLGIHSNYIMMSGYDDFHYVGRPSAAERWTIC